MDARATRCAVIIAARSVNAAAMTAVMVVQLLRIEEHGIPAQAGELLALGAVPGIALMSVAGRLADRGAGVRIYATAVSLQALLTLVLGTTADLGIVLVLVALLETMAALLGPIWVVAIARTAAEIEVASVLANYYAVLSFAPIAGSAAAGLLYGLVGPERALIAVALVLCLTLAAAPAMSSAPAGRETVADRPRGGLAVVRRAPLLFRVLLVLLPVSFLLQCVAPLEVFLARGEMRIGPSAFGGVEALFGLGAVTGASASRWFGTDSARARGAVIVLAGAGVAAAVHGTTGHLAVYLVTAGVIGAAAALPNALVGTLLVTQTDPATRGRAAAAMNGLSQGVALAALSIGGFLGTTTGIREAFALSGGLSLGVGLLGWVFVRRSVG